jgi:hypothetical protein
MKLFDFCHKHIMKPEGPVILNLDARRLVLPPKRVALVVMIMIIIVSAKVERRYIMAMVMAIVRMG